jgi:tetratricopeptide (TPR) repeat protein
LPTVHKLDGVQFSKQHWPTHGAVRALLEYLDELHSDAGRPSYRQIGEEVRLAPGTLSPYFTGRRLISEGNLELVVRFFGGDQAKARRLWRKAAAEWRNRTVPVVAESSPKAGPARETPRLVYLEQVRRIAPPVLYGRERELAELAEFSAGTGDREYLWWRAPAWTGKSALLSWFVLHPPAGVQVVSFFVTGRYAGQGDRVAFVDNILDQLATLLGQPVGGLTETTREVYLLSMLADAAAWYHDRDQRLVLVVDGLDEDRGVTAGPDTHSVAALLPDRPPPGLRVVVAGRPEPPIPSDVPDRHPMRDPSIVRTLTPSPHAEVVRVDAERELKRLLHGSTTDQDLLGLVTVAGGGLAARDLAELTNQPPERIEEHLTAVAGRTFSRRAGAYLLGHEDLQREAVLFLRPHRLHGYRQRIHVWAQRYRDQRWPDDTPRYLVRGYYQLLKETGDLPRMVACATDPDRHTRLLEITGSGHAALVEIITSEDIMRGQPVPDLAALASLAYHHGRLSGRNANLPTNLPAVWAMIGAPAGGEALARSITDPVRQADALAQLVPAMAAAGDIEGAETMSRSITEPDRQALALARLAQVVLRTGEAERAEALADEADPQLPLGSAWQVQAETRRLADTVRVDVVAGIAMAGALDRAEKIARSTQDPDLQQRMLARVAPIAAAAGEVDRAKHLAILAKYSHPEVLVDIATAVATTGDHDRAEALARSIRLPPWQARALAGLVPVIAGTGDIDRARTVAHQAARINIYRYTRHPTSTDDLAVSPVDCHRRVKILTHVVSALVGVGEVARGEELAHQAETRWAVSPPTPVLVDLVGAAAAIGDFDWVQKVAGSIREPLERVRTLTDLVPAYVAAGDVERARNLVDCAALLTASITDPGDQAPAWADLACAMVHLGDADGAVDYARRAETRARSITDPGPLAEALARLVPAVVGTAGLERAKMLAERAAALVSSTTDEHMRSGVQAELSRAFAVVGELGDAESAARAANPHRLALVGPSRAMAETGSIDRAQAPTRSIIHDGPQIRALADLIPAVVKTGDTDRATALAKEIEAMAWERYRLDRSGDDLLTAARAYTAAGHLDRAEVLARSIPEDRSQVRALAELAQVAFRTGDPDRAASLADHAEDVLSGVLDEMRHHEAATPLVPALVAIGRLDRARSVISRAEAMLRARGRRPDAYRLAGLIPAVAATGDTRHAAALADEAEALVRAIRDPENRNRDLHSVASALAAIGDIDRAEDLTRSITGPQDRADALVGVAAHAEPARAVALLAQALHISPSMATLAGLAGIRPAAVTPVVDAILREAVTPGSTGAASVERNGADEEQDVH